MKKYSVIYADPPWRYRVYSKKGLGRSAESHYPTMSLEEIKALPIGELAAKDCVLFMWITFPCMQEAFQVLEAWGFEYKTTAFCLDQAEPGVRQSLLGHGLLDTGECRTLHPCNERPSQTGKPRCASGHHEPHRRALQETGGSPQPHRPAHGRCPAHRTFRPPVPRRLGCMGQ